MAIIQISKLQARSGNLVDLPQLDEAEFAWASDDKRLFIGKTTPNENIEVLTGYSNISYSQITGSVGNLNINPVNVADGQALIYDGTNWVNRGGTAGGLITLGTASNVKITGGAIGYVLETDGLGNLAWTPKGSLYSNIVGLSNATPIVMTVANTTPLTNDLQVTISGANGVSNSIVNGQSFYIQLAVDFPTSGNVSLYTGTGGTGPVVGTGLTYTNSPNAIATSIVAGSGGGSGAAQGANTSIQYNNSGAIDGSADLTWDFGTAKLFTVNGNANVGNLNATGVGTATRFISNIATGTTPIQVVSTTRVANLNVSYANVADFEVVTTQTTGTFYPVFVSGNTTANYALGSNANISVNAATGALSATLLTGTLTTAAQPNITSTGSLTAPAFLANSATGRVGLVTDSGGSISMGLVDGNSSSPYLDFNASNTAVDYNVRLQASGAATGVGGGTLTASAAIVAIGNALTVATTANVTGNLTAGNVIATSFHVHGVATGISAAGATQATGTALAKDFNVVSTVISGANGVTLPTAVAGYRISIINTSANALNVYPLGNGIINSGAANAAYSQPAGARLDFICTTSTTAPGGQWYTLNATYG